MQACILPWYTALCEVAVLSAAYTARASRKSARLHLPIDIWHVETQLKHPDIEADISRRTCIHHPLPLRVAFCRDVPSIFSAPQTAGLHPVTGEGASSKLGILGFGAQGSVLDKRVLKGLSGAPNPKSLKNKSLNRLCTSGHLLASCHPHSG